MTGARGLLAGGVVLAWMVLVGSACAQKPPQASSVQGVYDCALKLLEAERWSVADSRTGPPTGQSQDPQYLIAVLERNANYLNLDVRREAGAVVAKVSTPQAGGLAEEAGRLQQRIISGCTRK